MSKEMEEERDYRIPEPQRGEIGYAKAAVLEILDEIFRTSIDVNLLEPQVIVREKPVVKLAE